MSDYTLADALALMQSMEADAERDCAMMEHQGHEKMTTWWEAWSAALWTLRHHIETGVKVTCFPIGNCRCHPLKTGREKI